MRLPTASRLAVLLLASLSASLGAVAESPTPEGPPPAPHAAADAPRLRFDPERRLARLTARLGLTAEQQAQLRPFFAAQAEEMKAIETAALSPDERRAKMRALHKDDRAKIGAVLSAAQRAKFAAQPGRRDHEGRNGAAEPPRDAEPGE